MSFIDEKRLIYGTVKVQGEEFYLLEAKPMSRSMWQPEGTVKWLVASVENATWGKDHESTYPLYFPSYVVFGSSALVELVPDPSTYKRVRFTLDDDEESYDSVER